MVKKRSIGQARRLANVLIFIDDVVAVSVGGEFERGFKEIHPPEVIIEMENLNNNEKYVLDLFIKAGNKQFHMHLYKKRGDSPFSKARTTYWRNSISSRMFSSTYGFEFLKTLRIL